MNTKPTPKFAARPLPAGLAEVALIDGATAAAGGDMSISWWLEEVRAGRAPAPAIRKPRCTRWRLAEVRAFWVEMASMGETDPRSAELVKAQAIKASAKAKAKRAAAIAQVAS